MGDEDDDDALVHLDVPVELVQELMVMGFPEEWCAMALREKNNDIVNASAWIVDNLDMLSSLRDGGTIQYNSSTRQISILPWDMVSQQLQA